jgi:hypothetical protein
MFLDLSTERVKTLPDKTKKIGTASLYGWYNSINEARRGNAPSRKWI